MNDIATATVPVDPTEEFAEETVEVHRDGPLSGLVGAVAAGLAVAYLLRVVGSGTPLDWALCAVTGVIGAVYLAAFVDSRAPLMVVDRHGVRLRRGRIWQGLAWDEVDGVEHRPRRSLVRDGSLTVVPTAGPRLAVRLSMSTRLVGADWHELAGALTELSDGRTVVEEIDVDEHDTEPESVAEAGTGTDAEPPGTISPKPGRTLRRGRRHEAVASPHEPEAETDGVEPVADDETQVFVLPLAGDTSTVVISAGDVPTAPSDPVIGPQLAATRIRLGLSVDQLAERTRIRPHVIESIELDDFGPCGGDFYARGHLRTLARILAVDAEPLVAEYDERYSDAPIDPRRVFEAELATGGGGAIRGTRGRLNWSVLVAAVMAVVLLWSIARLVTEGPMQIADRPVLNGSPGGERAQLAGSEVETVPLSFTAATGGARVIVRDGRQRVVFNQDVAFMQTVVLKVVPPVVISTTDAGLTVELDGDDLGALGASGQAAQRTYVPGD